MPQVVSEKDPFNIFQEKWRIKITILERVMRNQIFAGVTPQFKIFMILRAIVQCFSVNISMCMAKYQKSSSVSLAFENC